MMMLNTDAKFKKNNGLTLIELLIALVMSGILIAALYRIFISEQKTYTVQEQVVDIQQNARVAINRMMREIRMAGFGNISTVLPVTFGMRTFSNVVNPDTPVAGSVTIVSAMREGGTITEISGSNQIKVSSIADFDINDNSNKKYISIGGLESHTISAIDKKEKKITLTKTMIHHHSIGTPVFAVRAISYEVVRESGRTTLKRDENIGGGRQPLAENIENIQFEYFDANGDPTAIPVTIRMIRITVTARTPLSDPEFGGGDGYRRRQVASNIHIRNMGLSP